jgi:hypothetical protein
VKNLKKSEDENPLIFYKKHLTNHPGYVIIIPEGNREEIKQNDDE